MTAGTERWHEAASKLEKEGSEFDIVINIQGDEPLIDPEIINRCVHALKSAPDAMYRSASRPLCIYADLDVKFCQYL